MRVTFMPHRPNSFEVGRDVFGPILAEFMLRLWAFGSSVPHPENTKLLFCARGGLRLKFLFEDFIGRTGLTFPLAFDHLMISRLVAVRPALLRREDAALDEVGSEFKDATIGAAALALSQVSLTLAKEWEQPFTRAAFVQSLWADTADSRLVLQAIEFQHRLFRRHFDARRGTASEIILCDTGLNGSTLKLLALGMPDFSLSCALFARSNYKGFDSRHFSQTAGLSIERDTYSPFAVRTALFRYWQLFEDLLEPKVPSVRTFASSSDGAEPTSNLEVEDWRAQIAPNGSDLFAGVCAHFESLNGSYLPLVLAGQARAAWHRLRRIIVCPTPQEVRALRTGDRSRDFGRSEKVPAFAAKRSGVQSLGAVTSSLWKEGNVVVAHPRFRHVLFAGIEAAYLVRPITRRFKHRVGQLTGKLSVRGVTS